MFREPARFFFSFRVEKLDHSARSIHATSRVDSGTNAKAEIVGSHLAVFAATCNFNQSSQPVIYGAWQIGKSERDNRPILSNQFCDVCDRANRNHLQKTRYLRFAAALSKQGVDQFEGNADASQILVRIFTAVLIRVQHRQRRGRAFILVRQMMVSDDDIEAFCARPMKRFVRGDAAVDAEDQFVSFAGSFFEGVLANAVTLSEAMRYVITRGRT